MSELSTSDFSERLRRAIDLPPPDVARLRGYLPELAYGRHRGPIPDNAKRGAVLVLVYPVAKVWSVVLTVRQSHLPTHAGQVSFPGGKIDPSETPVQAALREYEEEMGALPDHELIGTLPELYIYASNFRVTPCVALACEEPRFQPHAAEVADVLSVSLAALADRSRLVMHTIQRGPLRFRAPAWRSGSRMVWGATWIVLGELLERLQSLGPLPTRCSR